MAWKTVESSVIKWKSILGLPVEGIFRGIRALGKSEVIDLETEDGLETYSGNAQLVGKLRRGAKLGDRVRIVHTGEVPSAKPGHSPMAAFDVAVDDPDADGAA